MLDNIDAAGEPRVSLLRHWRYPGSDMTEQCREPEYMPEGEVARRLALWLFEQPESANVVTLCLDGNHVQHFEKEHFSRQECENGALVSSWKFYEEARVGRRRAKWPGTWRDECGREVVVGSSPTRQRSPETVCDLTTAIKKGRLRVECKGMDENVSRIKLQECIGQMVTIRDRENKDILAVAVPYSPRLVELATEFLRSPIFRELRIAIALVHDHNVVDWWHWNGEQVHLVGLGDLQP